MQTLSAARIEQIIPTHCQLGEGAYYSVSRRQAIWVDIFGKKIYTLDWPSRVVTEYLQSRPVCWVKESEDGRLIAGLYDGIYFLDDGFVPTEKLWALHESRNGYRLNDAKASREGELYFGSMDIGETRPGGKLMRLSYNDKSEITADIVHQGYIVSNGPAFSPNGDFLYSVSSPHRCVFRLPISPDEGYSSPEVLLRFEESDGFPDGITVSANGELWIACWNGTGIRRFDTAGDLIEKIELPAVKVTSVAFIGDDLSHLLVTTAKKGTESDTISACTENGNTFILSLLVKGLAELPVKIPGNC